MHEMISKHQNEGKSVLEHVLDRVYQQNPKDENKV